MEKEENFVKKVNSDNNEENIDADKSIKSEVDPQKKEVKEITPEEKIIELEDKL